MESTIEIIWLMLVVYLPWPQSYVLDFAIVIIWLMLSVYSGVTEVLVSSVFYY